MHRILLAAVAALLATALPAFAGPNDIVLIFANETYAGTVPKAGFAHRDGEEVRRAAREVLGVPESRIVLIKDATSGTFQDWFEPGGGVGPVLGQLPIRRDSTIYVYFSGHGLPAKRSGATDAEPFLLPVDTPPALVARRGLAVADVRKALLAAQAARAPDGRVILWLDACFTGSSGGGDLVTDARSVRISPSAVRKAEPRLVEIAAASFDQEALWDSKRGHGVFTDTLLDGLYGGADLDKDGHVTADELHRFLVDRVEERVARLFPSPRRFQSPVLAGDGTIRVASITGAVRDPALRAEMQARCTTMKASSDAAEVRAFLGDCGATCPCLAELQKRLQDLERTSSACIGEGRELARLEKLGPRAAPQLRALADAAQCADVASKARSLVASLLAPPPPQPPKAAAPPPPVAAIPPSPTFRFVSPPTGGRPTKSTGDDAPVTECDRLAASPEDDSRKVAPIHRDLIGEDAVTACRSALSRYPGSPRLNYQLGRALLVTGQTNESTRYFKMSAEAGYPIAMAYYGLAYHKGRGVQKNRAEAAEWYRKAAEAGEKLGMLNWAQSLTIGDVVRKNEIEGRRWALKAAEAGLPSAMHFYGTLLDRGLGGPRDLKGAVGWYRKSAEAGSPAGMEAMAAVLAFGDGAGKNVPEAANLIIKALELGDRTTLDRMLNNNDEWGDEFRRAFQRRLKELGVYTGPINGKFDSGTKAAIEKIFGRKKE